MKFVGSKLKYNYYYYYTKRIEAVFIRGKSFQKIEVYTRDHFIKTIGNVYPMHKVCMYPMQDTCT